MNSLLITILFISLSCFSLSASEKFPGIWNTGNHNTVVKIEKKNDVFEGRIISTDSDNAQPGTLIVKDMKYEKGEWIGKIYSPKRDAWYNAAFSMGDETLTITVTVGFFSKTVEWKKIHD